jgi:hypothetical protein
MTECAGGEGEKEEGYSKQLTIRSTVGETGRATPA